MGIDEGYFHYERGLPKWERIGHPLDTASLWLCMGIALFAPFSSTALKVYGAFAILSCIMVTKDEFTHKHHCRASENWLHAFLFLLHPLILICTAMIWAAISAEVPTWLMELATHRSVLEMFLSVQTACTGIFLLYQIIFWNFIWINKPVKKY